MGQAAAGGDRQRDSKIRGNLEKAVRAAKVLDADKGLGAAVHKKIATGGRFAEDGALHVADLLADRVREVALHLEDGVGADLGLLLDCAVTLTRLIA